MVIAALTTLSFILPLSGVIGISLRAAGPVMISEFSGRRLQAGLDGG